MHWYLRRVAASFRRDAGSILVFAAVGFATVCGLAGLSIDVGSVAVDRRQLQNATDAAALAAAQQLPASPSAATADATSWMTKNGYGGSGALTVTYSSTFVANDTVTLAGHHDLSLHLAAVFGKGETSVNATGKAVAGGVAGINGILPFGLLPNNACFSGGHPIFGASCTLKLGSSDGHGGGDFGALSLGGTGSNVYRGNIANGSRDTYRIGQQVPTETGNMTGPSGQGLQDRLSREPTSGCGDGSGQDTFNEVFSFGAGGFAKLNCPTSPRVIILPVINQLASPQPSTITDFALMYIDDYKFNGGKSQITGRMVRVNITDPAAVFGAYTGSGLRIIRLAQ